jgi:hypothetical protein
MIFARVAECAIGIRCLTTWLCPNARSGRTILAPGAVSGALKARPIGPSSLAKLCDCEDDVIGRMRLMPFCGPRRSPLLRVQPVPMLDLLVHYL